jgi:hypothetical protein
MLPGNSSTNLTQDDSAFDGQCIKNKGVSIYKIDAMSGINTTQQHTQKEENTNTIK